MRSRKETVVLIYYMYNIIMDGIGTMRVYMPPPHTLAHAILGPFDPGCRKKRKRKPPTIIFYRKRV